MTALEDQLAKHWPGDIGYAARRAIHAMDRPGYHGQAHLLRVLDSLDDLWRAGELDDRRLVKMAAFFHDAIHGGAQGEDERKSADMAYYILNGDPLSEEEAGEVRRLILVTADHDPLPGDKSGQALSDADLGILADEPYEYARYMADVRDEYRSVANGLTFAAARRQVLLGLAGGEGVYHTGFARRMWEDQAQLNIQAEVVWLECWYGLGD